MESNSDPQEELVISRRNLSQRGSIADLVTPDANLPQEHLLDLIDLSVPNKPEDASILEKSYSPALDSKSLVEDFAGLQPVRADVQRPHLSKEDPMGHSSLLPLKTRSLKRNKRGRNRFDDLSNNRCSSPESIVSEMRRAQAMVDPLPVDPYTQWYQVMQCYYRQFYPGYDYESPAKAHHRLHVAPHAPKSVVPLTQPPAQSVNRVSQQQQQQMQAQLPFSFPGFPSWPPISPQSGLGRVPNPPHMQLPGYGQMPEYAAYYYQYYMGAWAAANGWPMPTGRTTPKIFIEPHIRANLVTPGLLIQILPNRPQDGEPGRIELLDISHLASDVVAEVTSRLSAVNMTGRKSTTHHHGVIFPNSYSSDGGLAASTNDEGDSRIDDIDGEEEEYMSLVNAWDRTDHALYPGPLSQCTTLKHDVQAFLRGKMEDIQDRMPVDWDSAGLLLSYLELLVKNSGVVHPSDVVNLLLGNDNSRTYDYPTGSNTITSVAPFPNISTRVARQNSFNTYTSTTPPIAAIGGGIGGGLYLDSTSGRASPRILTHSASMGGFLQLQSQQQGSGQGSTAASSTGGVSLSRSLRKGLLVEYGNAQEREAAALQRFRELLMHGHPLKALDHACQTRLWGHAFALALRLGSGPLDRVMEKFLARSVNLSDPLLTLYQLTAGEIPRSVDQLAYASGTDTGDWRPHLAMLLSAPEGHADLARESLERMGESLLARRLLFAAHLCFLLAAAAASNSSGTTQLMPSRIWLLGAAAPSAKFSEETGTFVMTPEVERASTEAIQFTEVYEFALTLATRDKHFFLPNFLPFKFAYCLRLIDAGLIEKAFRYLEVLSDSVSTLLEREVEEYDLSPVDLRALYLIASQCLCLSERLRHHPEVGSFESATGNHGDGSFGASDASSPCLDWMKRLNGVLQRVSSALGLPNSERPYVDPLRASSFQESPPPQQQQQLQHGQQTSQQARTTMASAAQPQASSWNSQSEPPCQQNPPPLRQNQQQQNVYHQSPPQIQQPKPTTVPQTPPNPRPQYQPIIHDNASPQNQPSTSPTFHQEQVRMSRDAHSHPSQQQQSSAHSPLPTAVNKVTDNRSHQQEQQQQKSPVGNTNLGFFVPTLDSSTGAIDSGNSTVGSGETPAFSGYDYFAGLANSQPDSRSRTVSMASSQDGSTFPSSSSPSTAGGGVGMLPSSSPLPPQVQRRLSGGQSAVATSSGNHTFLHDCEPQVHRRPGLKSRSPSSHRHVILSDSCDTSNGERTPTPRLSPMSLQRALMRDHRSRNAPSQSNSRGDANMNHTSAFVASPASVDNRRKVSGVIQSQQAQPEKQEEGEAKDNVGKTGWFSGLFGRIKGSGQEVYLPDDSNPSIVWDEATGRWRDKLRGDIDDSIPPPPSLPSAPAEVQNSTHSGTASPPLLPSHVRASGVSSSIRSRYVNVLAKQGVSSGPKAVSLAPPLPPNFFPSS